MHRTELMRGYWRYYRTLENRMIATSAYVEIWSFRYIPLVKAFAIVDGDVCQEG